MTLKAQGNLEMARSILCPLGKYWPKQRGKSQYRLVLDGWSLLASVVYHQIFELQTCSKHVLDQPR